MSEGGVLVVEDNTSELELLMRVLDKGDLQGRISVARDGAEALGVLRGSANLPRVVFLDLKLPKVDGLEVLQELRADARTQSIPVVVLTSSNQEKDLLNCYRSGANSYIVKPFDYDEFSQIVAAAGNYWMNVNRVPTITAGPVGSFVRKP